MTKRKANPQRAGRKPGSKNKIANHAEQELLADAMNHISLTRRRGWNGEGWSSPKEPAVHAAFNTRGHATSSAVEHLPGRNGRKVSRDNRFTDLSRQLDDPQRGQEFNAFRANPYSHEGRQFALCEIRRFTHYAGKRISAAGLFRVAKTEQLKIELTQLAGIIHLAEHHQDRSGVQILKALEDKAIRQFDALTRPRLISSKENSDPELKSGYFS